MPSILHRSSYILTGFIIGAGFLMLISQVMAFTEPTMAPPGDNAAPPLNTSPTAQIKQGPLSAAGNIVNTAPLGGWLGLTGDLPGYPLNQYPTLKTNGGYIYLSTENQYRGWIGGAYSGLGTNYLEIRDPLLNTTNAEISGIPTRHTYFAAAGGGNVGIGTSNPLQKLHVVGNIAATNIYSADVYSSANGGAWMSQLCRSNGTNCPAGSMVWGINGSSIYNINSGNVGIGTNNPSAKLHVNGNAFFDLPLGASPERHLTIKNAGTIQMPFGSYPGAWTPALQIQNNNNTRLIWLSPLDSASTGNARLVTIGSDFDITPNNTSEPFKFTSSGDLSVYGNIQSRTLNASLSQMCSNLNVTLLANCPGSAWTMSGTNVWTNSSVGILTSSPIAPLSVNGAIANVSSIGYGPVTLESWGLYNNGTYGGGNIYIEPKPGNSFYVVPSDWSQNLTSIFYGNIGIGMSPHNKLHVSGAVAATDWIGAGCEVNCEASGGYAIIYPDGRLSLNGVDIKWAGGVSYWGIGQPYGQVLYPGRIDAVTNYQPWWYLASHGSYGLYTNTGFRAEGPLYTASSVYMTGALFDYGGYYVNPSETSVMNEIKANAFYYNSDEQLKKDIQPIAGALEKVRQLAPVSFKWKENDANGIGFIAQDIEKVFPDIVSTDNATGLKSVQYGNLTAPLAEAIKELDNEVRALRLKNTELEKKINEMQNVMRESF